MVEQFFSNSGYLQILGDEGTTFIFNSATMGGAIFLNSYASLNGINVTRNNATKGGGIALGTLANSEFDLSFSSIINNAANIGGGFWIPTGGLSNNTRVIQGSTVIVSQNQAAIGGGLFLETINDPLAVNFIFKGLEFSFNQPNNIECDQLVPFCVPCNIPNDLPCVGSEINDTSLLCYTNKGIYCNNGYCAFVPSDSNPECICDPDFKGPLCDQEILSAGAGIAIVVIVSVGSALLLFGCMIYSLWTNRISQKNTQYQPVNELLG